MGHKCVRLIYKICNLWVVEAVAKWVGVCAARSIINKRHLNEFGLSQWSQKINFFKLLKNEMLFKNFNIAHFIKFLK